MKTQKSKKKKLKLNKKELITIKSKEIKWDINSVIFRVPAIKYIVMASVKKISAGEILVLEFYDKALVKEGNYKPCIKIFFSKDDYISLLCSENKWLTGSLDNIRYFNDSSNHDVFLFRTENDEKRMFKYLKIDSTKFSAIKGIISFQSKVRSLRLENKKRIIQNRYDTLMKNIKPVPKRFTQWIKNKAFENKRYIFYKRLSAKKYYALCCSCGKEVNIQYAKHNEKGKCPLCKKKIIFKSVGKSKNIVDLENVSLIEKMNNGFVVRYFTAYKSHKNNSIETEIDFYEYYRAFVNFLNDDIKIEYYIKNGYSKSGMQQWKKCRPKYEKSCYANITPVIEPSYIYTANLKYELKDTAFENLNFDIFCKNTGYLYGELAIRGFLKIPSAEYFTKLKLYNIAKSVIFSSSKYFTINSDGKSIKQLLGITRDQLHMLQKINALPEHLGIMQNLVINNIRFTIDDVVIIQKFLSGNAVDKFFSIIKYCTLHKAIKYIMEQNKGKEIYNYNGYYAVNPYNNTVSDWYDYISDCVLLNYDLKKTFILFPKNLTERHRELNKIVKKNNNKIMDRAISERHNMLAENYCFEYENLSVVIPRSSKEIVDEGSALSHCVGAGAYIENMAKGISDILFIRKKEDLTKSYYTVEVKNGKIQQCRGFDNCSANEEVKCFIDKWTPSLKSNSKCKEQFKEDVIVV